MDKYNINEWLEKTFLMDVFLIKNLIIKKMPIDKHLIN